ncbi:MAG: type II/IV secretion system ATPase subunit, partial [Candidatus Thermoplasmatota archaeon]|nr:type II/IV secretion system ATPase subunit [Candidatus Thermoplasmatota archaeon]
GTGNEGAFQAAKSNEKIPPFAGARKSISVNIQQRPAAKIEKEEALRAETKKELIISPEAKKPQAKKATAFEYVAPMIKEEPPTVVPPISDPALEEIEIHTIKEGYSYVRTIYDKGDNHYKYEVIEPILSTDEAEICKFIKETLIKTLESKAKAEYEELMKYLLEEIDHAIFDHSIYISPLSKKKIVYYIVRDFLGYSKIDVLMNDPMIEDISCDGPGIPIYIFHRIYESVRTNLIFTDDDEVDSFVIRLAQRCNKHISIAEPLLDATLPDKSRLQASLSREVTTRGSSFTIRRFRADPLTPPTLVEYGTMSSQMAAYFWMMMEYGASGIFSGGTASGKTTTLNAISMFIPPQRKIVSIEDTRELNLPHENWIAGLTRASFGSETASNIDMYKLLESALRQRPEYLIVGEVRGREAFTLFQAMATGHATYSTLHADSVPSAVYRLENPPIEIPRIMIQTLDVMSIQVSTKVGKKMVRRIKEITEITGIDPTTGELTINTIFKWDSENDKFIYYGGSKILGEIGQKKNMTYEQVEKEMNQRAGIIDWMRASRLYNYKRVAEMVSEYYSYPENVLKRAGGV